MHQLDFKVIIEYLPAILDGLAMTVQISILSIICGTGIGIGLAANKVRGIRCAMVSEPYSAMMARRHNDANMISIGARVLGEEMAKMIVRAFLTGNIEQSVRNFLG